LQPDNTSGTIKEQLAAIAPALEQLWQQKEERIKDFSDVQSQIQRICGEITGSSNVNDVPVVDESDLTLKKLEEYQSELQELQKEKVIGCRIQYYCSWSQIWKLHLISLTKQHIDSFIALLCLAE
jgi:hypothetical protein